MGKKSNSEHRRRRCVSKIVYDSWWLAEQAALLLMDDLRDGKLPIKKQGGVYAYRCSVCSRWHVGHQPRPRNPWNHWRSFLEHRHAVRAV